MRRKFYHEFWDDLNICIYERRNIGRKTHTLSLPQISHSTRSSVDLVDAIILSLCFVKLFHRQSQKSKEM